MKNKDGWNMRVKSDHYYVLRDHPGISGFKRVNEWTECIVTGHKARHNRSILDREYLANGLGRFRLGDGHLPDYQPIVNEVEALRWLDSNLYQAIVEMV